MSNLIVINNVRGYIDNQGIAKLNLEDVSRGLGFTETKDGREYVMWRRVDGYLSDLKFGTSAENEFIPENIFYRLAMKAKNEAAERFQAKVADEILPQLRKTGSYSVKPVTAIEALAQTVQVLQEQENRIKQLEGTTQAIKETIITQPYNWRKDLNRMFNKIVEKIGDSKFRELRNESYTLLESRAHVNLNERLRRLKKRMEDSGETKTNIEKTNRLDVIEQDPKLREIYGKIIQEYTIKYVA